MCEERIGGGGAGENGDEEGKGRGFQEGDVLESLPCIKRGKQMDEERQERKHREGGGRVCSSDSSVQEGGGSKIDRGVVSRSD